MLKGKAAIITGSSRGIGRQIALTFAKNGADVIINGNRPEPLTELKEEIIRLGSRCEIVQGDVSLFETSQKMADTCINAFGKIDILVNNAGVNSRIPFLELSAEEWDRMLGINLNGTFYACKCVLPHMVNARQGTIINISSTASKTAHANASICYGASKAAVNSMTQKLAYEMAPYGIRVNGVCPGPIYTDMSKQWTDEYRQIVTKKIPLGRLGTPENVADVVMFLATDMAGFITGETINVNGGSYMN
ncbi:MAG: SDR family NAD(P)-dependent oxidoreductase [Lachnospiraceae bacterium]|nr:SDR family NAD(P)-dependent oxidoreductase [Lachnospiraceae bacterium]